MKNLIFSHFYPYESVPDALLPSIFAEFRDNGVKNLVFTDCFIKRILREPLFFGFLKRLCINTGVRLQEMHSPFGECYDFLIVTDYKEDWEYLLTKADQGFYATAYVWNKSDEYCSEFGDISVVSFDDTPLCESLIPNLTSVGAKKEVFAQKALNAMLENINSNKHPIIQLRPNFSERKSVKNISNL